MQFTKAFLALAIVAAPILAAPAAVAENGLEARATTVTCNPSKNSSPAKPFKVDVNDAKAQAKIAGFTAGKSGDPHGYGNGDGITWGVDNCDRKKNPLHEYPIFWVGSEQKEWEKDTRSKSQQRTPIRVVYANVNGAIVYCGIMTHSVVDKEYQGSKAFEKCG